MNRMHVLLAAALALWPAVSHAQVPFVPPERPDDPPIYVSDTHAALSPASIVTFGRFTSVQVNVNGAGANIVGDAANEPSIAVDPNDHTRMAIGWRQFDSRNSNFREAGYGFTVNGGSTWSAGTIDNGVFRSDPVLAADADGDFFYLSLTGDLHSQVFPSPDHGVSWSAPVTSYGGDKPWFVFDRTGGPGRDHAYQAWNTSGNSYAPNTFDRSIDDAESFEAPSEIAGTPIFGSLDVAADGTLWVVGTSPFGMVVARSDDAQNSVGPPSWETVPIDLGGGILGSVPPNPVGLLGTLWIAADRSSSPTAGWVYVLASVRTPADPLDVNLIMTDDRGQSWTAPVTVNDDPPGQRAYQWFGTLSVSPDGRLDAVWNDSRGQDSLHCALYYAYSMDGGYTWSPNEQATPVWNATLGWPKQNKIGDYYHMVSDVDGADLAYAATFNGEQDVYYLRLTPPPSTTAVPGPRDATRPRLEPARPNPFRAATTLRYQAPAGGGDVTLEVIDLAGRRVATLARGFHAAGTHVATWNGENGAGRGALPGVYVIRCAATGRVETRRVVRVR